MHPLAPNQTNAKQVLSRRCAKSSYKTKMNKMECAVCYDMKNIVNISKKYNIKFALTVKIGGVNKTNLKNNFTFPRYDTNDISSLF